jgi:WD40 repeat protein/transcriptional regulator with XRE-family HTH domain
MGIAPAGRERWQIAAGWIWRWGHVDGNIPLDPEDPDPDLIATARDFGRELTLARRRAGLTIRDVARATGIPVSTTGDYFSGSHLPPAGQPRLLEEILRVCGVTDKSSVQKWMSALSRARRAPGKRAARVTAPYRGLASFEPEDAPLFFGRAELTEQLVAMATATAGAVGVPLAVVGPSGSGKSSLLRAGLVPRLLAGHRSPGGPWSAARRLILLTPPPRPLRDLAERLSELAADGGGAAPDPGEIGAGLRRDPASAAALPVAGSPAGTPVLVVDQFEAVFSDCPDEDERRAFISAVCALSGAAVVAIALRSDFYDRALRYPDLARALGDRQVVVGPMTQAQVRSAIIEPARAVGLEVEDGLVEILLRDLAPTGAAGNALDTAHEAGALPLLSHAMLATWERSRGGRITVADYRASGGIRDAIARTAEAVYADLGEDEKVMARRLFLRLVHVADDAPDTRAALPLSELRGSDGETAAGRLLDRFVAERLITIDADTARITHEALLTAWPRLREWIEVGGENMRAGRRISQAARVWEETGREGASLLRGSQLGVARDWMADPDNRDSLSQLAHEFIDSSIVQDVSRQEAERRGTRRLRRLVASLMVLLVLTFGLVLYSFQQRQAADTARDVATTARDSADSREVAIEADQIRGQNVSLAAQLSLAAYRIAATSMARSSLLESSGTPAAARLIDSLGVVQAVALSPDHRLLAVAAADGTLRLWDVARPGHPVPVGEPLLPSSDMPLYATAFSPNGQVLAVAGESKKIMLWDVSASGRQARMAAELPGPANTVYSLAFGQGGRVLAAGSADGTVRLWNVTDLLRPAPLATVTGPGGFVQAVAFSADGAMLAAGDASGRVEVWDASDPAHPVPLGRPLGGPAGPVYSVAFSPGGGLLAAGSQDEKVWLWRIVGAGPAARPMPAGSPLTGPTDWVNALAFSPDGASLAAGSSDGDARVWQVSGWRLTADLPQPQPVTSVAWDGEGYLITADADGTVRSWSLPTPVMYTGSAVYSIAYSPDGRLLAAGSQDLELWSPAGCKLLAARSVSAAYVNAVAFAPHAPILAAGYANGMVQLWSAAGGKLTPIGAPFLGTTLGPSESVAFSPDGDLLAEGGNDGKVRLWEVSDPARPRPLATVNDSGISYVFAVAFSPDGRTLAAASSDGLTRLWQVSNPDRPRLLGSPLAGPASYALSVAFSPDGRFLAVGSADKTVRLWNVSNPARPARLRSRLTGPSGYIYSVAFSPDGHTLAAAVTDGTVWLWKMADPGHPGLLATLRATLTGAAGQVFAVAFSPSGQSLAAGSTDGTLRLWDTGVGAAADAVCATAGQPITRSEWMASIPGLPYQPPCRAR